MAREGVPRQERLATQRPRGVSYPGPSAGRSGRKARGRSHRKAGKSTARPGDTVFRQGKAIKKAGAKQRTKTPHEGAGPPTVEKDPNTNQVHMRRELRDQGQARAPQ
eukprot:gene32810-33866_t